jgi:hypothetical protein
MGKYLLANNGKFSGTADNITYQRNGIFRDWVSPTNTSTSYKQFILDAITFYSQQWKLLTQSSQDSWYIYKGSELDVFKIHNTVQGINLFIKKNVIAAILQNDNATVHLRVNVNFIGQYIPVVVNSIFIDSTQYLIDIADCDTDIIYIVYATDNLSFGINKPRRCEFKIVGSYSFFVGVQDIYADWRTRFGHNTVVGSKIFTRIIPVNKNFYNKYPPLQYKNVVQ